MTRALSPQAIEVRGFPASKSDQAIALVDSINHLRVARDMCDAQELHGAADAIGDCMARLRRMLQLLKEDGFLWLAERTSRSDPGLLSASEKGPFEQAALAETAASSLPTEGRE